MPPCRGHRPKGGRAAQKSITHPLCLPGHRLKSVYAARTTEASQPRFDYFLRMMARHLGATATVKNIASTHVTLLESEGVKRQFYSNEFTERDVKRFSKHLQIKIDKAGHGKTPMKAKVDPDQPLRWVGWDEEPFIFALNLQLDERMKDQRGIIENSLVEEFGELPPIREFEPHITLGGIKYFWRERFAGQEIPDGVLPGYPDVPKTIVLNGLAVYLDRTIHSPNGGVAV